MATPQKPEPKRRRERGDDGISWDKINKCYVGTISLGYDGNGKRIRRTVRGKTKAEVKDKLDKLHDEIKAGIRTPATYTVEAVRRRLARLLTLDPRHLGQYRGQAEKWIYPKIGATKLKDFKVADADRFFKGLGRVLGKRVADDDQEHAAPVDPPSPEARPHRQERRRAGRPAEASRGARPGP